MKSLKGTQTEKNILTAFAGESQARNRYVFFASKAKKDGYVQISQTFETIAQQEKEHAERLFKFLEGGAVEITASYPAGIIGDTYDNLIASASGENEEYSHMYPEFADVAEKEGFLEIADIMRHIAIAEQYHESLFLKFAEHIKSGTTFKRENVVHWHCRNCGYNTHDTTAPEKCPACNHAQAYFDVIH